MLDHQRTEKVDRWRPYDLTSVLPCPAVAISRSNEAAVRTGRRGDTWCIRTPPTMAHTAKVCPFCGAFEELTPPREPANRTAPPHGPSQQGTPTDGKRMLDQALPASAACVRLEFADVSLDSGVADDPELPSNTEHRQPSANSAVLVLREFVQDADMLCLALSRIDKVLISPLVPQSLARSPNVAGKREPNSAAPHRPFGLGPPLLPVPCMLAAIRAPSGSGGTQDNQDSGTRSPLQSDSVGAKQKGHGAPFAWSQSTRYSWTHSLQSRWTLRFPSAIWRPIRRSILRITSKHVPFGMGCDTLVPYAVQILGRALNDSLSGLSGGLVPHVRPYLAQRQDLLSRT
ncbi:hypothetical protein FVE85_3474 [Porphyridium purpureum]|uniref:Uncharacterized protein n=1 Tax=Porphyridium purpureum TaxID=35688 RepID=A0A5J4YKU4_PORPP|nr:hypothetical protein FVE85_3474 [Porphyridium purpureum]|eukprot:POR3294..scf249_10